MSQPSEISDLLAPFFEEIDPINEAQQQVDQMDQLNNTTLSLRDELTALRDDVQVQTENDDQNTLTLNFTLTRLLDRFDQFLDQQGVA